MITTLALTLYISGATVINRNPPLVCHTVRILEGTRIGQDFIYTHVPYKICYAIDVTSRLELCTQLSRHYDVNLAAKICKQLTKDGIPAP